MKWYETLLNYLTQESTWVGLLSIITAFGVALSPEMITQIVACALGVFGLIKVIVNEKKEKKE